MNANNCILIGPAHGFMNTTSNKLIISPHFTNHLINAEANSGPDQSKINFSAKELSIGGAPSQTLKPEFNLIQLESRVSANEIIATQNVIQRVAAGDHNYFQTHYKADNSHSAGSKNCQMMLEPYQSGVNTTIMKIGKLNTTTDPAVEINGELKITAPLENSTSYNNLPNDILYKDANGFIKIKGSGGGGGGGLLF
jgi:hypothetical protein